MRAVAQRNLGDVLAAQGHTEAALAQYRASLVLTEARAAQDPANNDRQRELADSHEKMGRVLQARADIAAALVEFRAALVVRERLAVRSPRDSSCSGTLRWHTPRSATCSSIRATPVERS